MARAIWTNWRCPAASWAGLASSKLRPAMHDADQALLRQWHAREHGESLLVRMLIDKSEASSSVPNDDPAHALLGAVRASYDAAVAKYVKDRKAGLAELRSFAERYAWLPEGQAARAFADSDGLRAAIDLAKADRKSKPLEEAIRAFPKGLFMYEAKSLLVDLGGRDLFEPGERVGGKKEEGPGEEEKPRKKDESGIEVSDD